MELRRITLTGDRQLSDGQQKLSRYIECYTGMPFTGETYQQWQTWVDLNKPVADQYKREEEKKAAQMQQVADEVHDTITATRKHKRHVHPNTGRTVFMDYDALRELVSRSNMTMSGLNLLLGQNSSYLASRHSKYGDEIPESFVPVICKALKCEPADFISGLEPTEPETVESDTVIRNRIEVTPDALTITPCVATELTDRLKGYAMFTGRTYDEIVKEAVEMFLDGELLMMGREPKEEESNG